MTKARTKTQVLTTNILSSNYVIISTELNPRCVGVEESVKQCKSEIAVESQSNKITVHCIHYTQQVFLVGLGRSENSFKCGQRWVGGYGNRIRMYPLKARVWIMSDI